MAIDFHFFFSKTKVISVLFTGSLKKGIEVGDIYYNFIFNYSNIKHILLPVYLLILINFSTNQKCKKKRKIPQFLFEGWPCM